MLIQNLYQSHLRAGVLFMVSQGDRDIRASGDEVGQKT